MRNNTGITLAEILICIAIMAVLAAASLPNIAGMAAAGKVRGATRAIASVFKQARWEAVAKGRYVGVVFREQEDGYTYSTYEDGNANGIRKTDIESGKDLLISGPHRLRNRYGRIDFGFVQKTGIRKIPPEKGYIEDTEDPIKFGKSDIASFSPAGDSSSGTVYISDGKERMMAVVLFGPTVRVRIWNYVLEENRWK